MDEKDFIDKKEEFVKVLENYLINKNKEELFKNLEKFKNDPNFIDKELFKKIIEELHNYINELTDKEIKQRILLAKSYIY